MRHRGGNSQSSQGAGGPARESCGGRGGRGEGLGFVLCTLQEPLEGTHQAAGAGRVRGRDRPEAGGQRARGPHLSSAAGAEEDGLLVDGGRAQGEWGKEHREASRVCRPLSTSFSDPRHLQGHIFLLRRAGKPVRTSVLTSTNLALAGVPGFQGQPPRVWHTAASGFLSTASSEHMPEETLPPRPARRRCPAGSRLRRTGPTAGKGGPGLLVGAEAGRPALPGGWRWH